MSNKNKLEQILAELKSLSSNADEATIDSLIETLQKARKRAGVYDPNNPDEDFYSEGDEGMFDGLREVDEETDKRLLEEDDAEAERRHRGEEDPDEEQDDADAWLDANDPDRQDDDEEEEQEDEYESDEDEDQELHDDGDQGIDEEEQEAEEPVAQDSPQMPEAPQEEPAKPTEAPVQVEAPEAAFDESETPEEVEYHGRFPTPTPQELAEIRQYTRPYEQRTREYERLKADASKNPILHHEGKLIEARNASHKSFNDAYQAFINSPEYQNADFVTQMQMDTDFHNQWHEKNPDHLTEAQAAHRKAHAQGLEARAKHAALKDEQIMHIMRGGAQSADTVSAEAGMQMAGGSKDEEGTTGAMVQDAATSFAGSNQDFLNQLQRHAKGYKTVKEFEDKMRELRNPKMRDKALQSNPELTFAEQNQPIIRRMLRANERARSGQPTDDMNYGADPDVNASAILGDHPALKDPMKSQRANKFFERYWPLIDMNSRRVLAKLGIDAKRPGDIDVGALREVGLNGLIQAINDYDHGNPKKTRFSTHASNKMRGLMQTALRNMDAIPAELRAAAKQQRPASKNVVTGTAPAVGSKVEAPTQKPPATDVIAQSGHPASQEMLDRLKRADTQRAAHGVTKPPKPEGGNE